MTESKEISSARSARTISNLELGSIGKPFTLDTASHKKETAFSWSQPDGRLRALLFSLLVFATMTISLKDPFWTWAFELGIFMVAALCAKRGLTDKTKLVSPGTVTWIALTGIGLFGFVQWAFHWTQYRYATLEGAVARAGLIAGAFAGASILGHPHRLHAFLRATAWFAGALSVLSIVAYYTSPGTLFWIFPSRYPDVWGPFYSRNEFAAFLEVTFPIAWWGTAEAGLVAGWPALAIFVAGIASASRAGAGLLVIELLICLGFTFARNPRFCRNFLLAAVPLIVIAGPVLWLRLQQPDRFGVRREITQSAWSMIEEHPLKGYGLGTFSQVYPAYATFDSGAIVEHAHSDWLEWTTEGGMVFTLCWLWVSIAAVKATLTAPWALGIPVVFVHALVDDPFLHFGIAAWIFILTGALQAGRFEKKDSRQALELFGKNQKEEIIR